MTRFTTMRRALAATGAVLLALAAAPAAAASLYLGLGDSITFGETDLNYVQSAGDRGYVARFADTLAARNGGVRPGVVNLAIDGETASSFFTGSGRTPPVQGRTDIPLQQENSNYASPALTQSALFATTVANARANGNTIDNVSITLGFNELAALAALPPATAQADIAPTLAAYRNNFSAVLTQVRTLLPDANLYLLGYYNPFPADPASPAAPIFNAGGMALNAAIRDLAASFGARYVDTATPFLGHEADYTYLDEQPHGSSVGGAFGGVLPIGNVHPNAAGYDAIARQLAAAVPEPASWTMLIVGFGAVGGATRRTRRLAATA